MAEAGLVLDGAAVAPWGRTMLPATSIVVPPGSSLGITGDAGIGKSTVLGVLAGQRRPDSGAVRLDGAPLDASRVGVVEQQHVLPDGLTAAEHLVVPLLARGARPTGWEAIEALLAALGLPAAAHHNLLEELSGGQQQRVAIARALIGDPPLICADDPVSELDAASADRVHGVLRRAVERGAVLVLATPRAEEAARCDQVLRLG